MFYFKNWERFCKNLSNNKNIILCTSEQSLDLNNKNRFVVLKHDVETNVPNAYKLAEIEHKFGIKGSYYVQAYLLDDIENVKLLQKMQKWGHEISYHYDVLDAHSGDYKAAEEAFIKKSKIFENYGFHYRTICQHGNPVKKRVGYHSNRDFFRNPEIRKRYPQWVDMVVNYSQYAVNEYLYISDASYRWNIITEPETNDINPDAKNIRIKNFNELFKQISNSNKSFIISTHPHRWMKQSWKINIKICVFYIIKNIVNFLQYIPGIKWFMNKFYYLAKNI